MQVAGLNSEENKLSSIVPSTGPMNILPVRDIPASASHLLNALKAWTGTIRLGPRPFIVSQEKDTKDGPPMLIASLEIMTIY
jgi:hypothetical protein